MYARPRHDGVTVNVVGMPVMLCACIQASVAVWLIIVSVIGEPFMSEHVNAFSKIMLLVSRSAADDAPGYARYQQFDHAKVSDVGGV